MTTDRRTTLKWAAAIAAIGGTGLGGVRLFRNPSMAPDDAASVPGYGLDPPLTGDKRRFWPDVVTIEQRRAIVRLADVYLPGDGVAPAASKLGIADFFGEWLSAPYPEQREDRRVLGPLLDAVSQKRGNLDAVRHAPALAAAAERFRLLATAAYYTTPEGMTAIGFVGNEARARFDGPPDAVLARLDDAFAALR